MIFMGVGNVVLVSLYLSQMLLNCTFLPLSTTSVTLCLFADMLSWT